MLLVILFDLGVHFPLWLLKLVIPNFWIGMMLALLALSIMIFGDTSDSSNIDAGSVRHDRFIFRNDLLNSYWIWIAICFALLGIVGVIPVWFIFKNWPKT